MSEAITPPPTLIDINDDVPALSPESPSSDSTHECISPTSDSNEHTPPSTRIEIPPSTNTEHENDTPIVSHDTCIYLAFEFTAKSLLENFPPRGTGVLIPPLSILGCSVDYKVVFRAIRAWRILGKDSQKERQNMDKNLSSQQKRKLQKNKKELIKARDIHRIPNTVTPSSTLLQPSPSDPSHQPTVRPPSERQLIAREIQRVSNRDAFEQEATPFVGMGSSNEDRVQLLKDKESLSTGYKKRKIGQRPTTISQMTHRVALDARAHALTHISRYIDTVSHSSTITKTPEHIPLTMILNEAATTNADGGRPSSVWRQKPEFILLCESKDKVKKVMKAFQDVFGNDQSQRNNYDVTVLVKDKDEENLLPFVTKFCDEAKDKRALESKRSLTLGEVQSNMDTVAYSSIQMSINTSDVRLNSIRSNY